MKRVLATMMSLALALNLFSVTVMAADSVTNEMIADAIVDGIASWDGDTRQQVYDSVILYRELESQDALLDLLYDNMVLMAANYGYDFSNTVIKNAYISILDQMMIDISDDDLEDYLGVNGSVNEAALKDYLMTDALMQDVFDLLNMMGYGVNNLGRGISVIETGLEIVEATIADRGVGNNDTVSFPIFYVQEINAETTNEKYGTSLEYNEDLTSVFIDHVNDVANKMIIENDQNAYNEVIKFVAYYNGSDTSVADMKLIYTYLSTYGYVVDKNASIISPTTIITVRTGGGGGGTVAETIITITGNTIIPQATFPMFSDLLGYEWAQEAIVRLFMFNIANGPKAPSFTLVPMEVEMFDDNGDVVTKTYEVRTFDGVTEGEYAPKNTVTRAQMAAFILRMMGDPVQTDLQNAYTDVPAGEWFTNEVLTALSLGYLDGISGLTDTEYLPTDTITREDIAIIMGNVLALKGEVLTAEDRTSLSLFVDSEAITPGSEDQVAMAVSRNILQGMVLEGQLYMKPQDSATRAELAVMLYRLAETVDTELYINPEVEETASN